MTLNSIDECLGLCATTDNCAYFDFFTSSGLCAALDGCEEFSADACTDCESGSIDDCLECFEEGFDAFI